MKTLILLAFAILFTTPVVSLVLPMFDEFASRCGALNSAVYDTVTDMCYSYQKLVSD